MAVQLTQTPYWWQAYGPFPPAGGGDFPHSGHVIRWYRKQRGWEIVDLARALGISERRAYELEEINAMPRNISRRKALVEILAIPPALMALPAVDLASAFGSRAGVLNPQVVAMYETVLDLSWKLYYTTSAHTAAGTIEQRLTELDSALACTRGVAQVQMLALKSRFLQLSAVISRDRVDLEGSLSASKEAITLARHVTNAEILAAALFRRARTYLALKSYDLAIRDLERALPLADHSRDPLRSYVAICLAEAYSLRYPEDRHVQQRCLAILDGVVRTVRASRADVLDGDGSFTRVDLPGVLMERANIERRFGMTDSAMETLAIVRRTLGPDLTRWQGNLCVAEANLYLVTGELDASCSVALDGLRLARATGSRANEQKIAALYRQAAQVQPDYDLVVKLRRSLENGAAGTVR